MKYPKYLLSVRNILLIGSFLLCSIQWSCSKSDGKIPYNSLYHATLIKSESGISVYSNHGRIGDGEIVKRFIATDSIYFSYMRDEIVNPYSTYHDTVEFIDEHHARMYVDYKWVSCNLSEQFPRLILTRNDTVTVYGIPYNPYSQTLPYWLCQYKPAIYQEWLESSTRGYYLFSYSGNEKFAFKLSGDQLFANMMLYVIHQNVPQSGFVVQSGYVNNFLDENFYQNLAVGDTVTVQPYSWQYEK